MAHCALAVPADADADALLSSHWACLNDVADDRDWLDDSSSILVLDTMKRRGYEWEAEMTVQDSFLCSC